MSRDFLFTVPLTRKSSFFVPSILFTSCGMVSLSDSVAISPKSISVVPDTPPNLLPSLASVLASLSYTSL